MHQRRYAGFAAVLFLSIGCGGGCGGCSELKTTLPSRPAVDTVPVADAMKLRLTRDGLDFFRQAIPPLLDQALANQEGQRARSRSRCQAPFSTGASLRSRVTSLSPMAATAAR